MWWQILIAVAVLCLAFRLFTFLFGNWRATLNRIITQYVAWKQMEPSFSDERIFMAILDHRYPEKTVYLKKMNERKNKIKESVKADIESKMSIIDKYSLPILIYTCLWIEKNSYLNSKRSIEELLEPIKSEVERQGFKKYC